MQCEACGATLRENAKVCPSCQAQVGAAEQYTSADDETGLAVIERFLSRYIMPHARIILVAAAVVVLLCVLLAWHPWRHVEQPSPYSFPVPGLQR